MKLLPKQPEKRNKVVGVFIGAVLAILLGLCYHDKAEKIPVASFFYDRMHQFEYKMLDLKYKIRGPMKENKISRDIVLLDYDDETEEWTPFPPDRAYYVEIIKALSEEESRARATFFDIFFFDPFGRQLDDDLAEVFREYFEALPEDIQLDAQITGEMKEKMFEAYSLLSSGASGERLQQARDIIQEITTMEDLHNILAAYSEVANYLYGNIDLGQLAPDRDIVLSSAITNSENVYLAQIVNNAEPTDYGIQDILFNPEIHKAFSKLLQMSDRTQTESSLEVEVNKTIRNMLPEDFRKLIADSEAEEIGGKKPLPLSAEVHQAIASETAKIQDKMNLALKLNVGIGIKIPEDAPLPLEEIPDHYRVLIEIRPLNVMISENAAGVGYVKPEFQKYDGTIRTAAPASLFRGKMYPHIDLMLAMKYLGVTNEDVVFHKDKIVLNNCRRPGSDKTEVITIPLFKKGSTLVNWAGTYYNPGHFHHRSFHLIYESAKKYNIIKKQEKIATIENMLSSEKQDLLFSVMEREAELDSPSQEELEQLEQQIPPETREELLAQISPEELEAAAPEQIRDFLLSSMGLEGEPMRSTMTPEQIREYRLQDLNSQDFDEKEWRLLSKLSMQDIQNLLNIGLNPVEQEVFAALTPDEIEQIKSELEFFKDKISMTGLTAQSTHDLNPMPFHPRYPLVGMHANLTNTIINNLFIHSAPFSIFLLALVILGVFTGYIGGSAKHLPGAAITIGTILVFGIFGQILFNYASMWFPIVPTLVALATIYLLIILYRYMTEGQEAIRMKKMFSTYVNPSVVDTLIQNPDMLQLGGERMDLSCIFSMATGPALETEDAEILVDRLNEYFTVMTDQIFEYDGTLDKYEGKIIMAVYGAPLQFDDHPTKVCLSLAGMKKAQEELNKKWAVEGKGEIKTIVGCNSGPMIAGNMGSASRFNYTVMGDSVNLAARILGASIQYGLDYVVSEYTYDRAQDDIIARLVDSIVVVGKEEPVRIYQIVGAKGDVLPDDIQQFLDAYSEGFRLYTERKWDESIAQFEKALALQPDDKSTDMLLKRTKAYKETPPGDNWKGEFVLTSKGL